jgi:hypothetical protein
MKLALVRRQEQCGVGDVPAGAHLAAQRHPGVALCGHLGAAAVAGPRKALLAPCSTGDMICWPVSPRVGNVKNNDRR